MTRVLILNQYFPPDRAATGLLLGQLAEDLSGEFEVTVVCGTPTYDPEPETPIDLSRLSVHQIPLLSFSRKNLLVRLLNYLTFLLGAGLRALTLPRSDIVVCWTDPPVVGLLGAFVARVQNSKFLFVSQDVYPEIALAIGRMNGPIAVSILRWTSKIILRAADRVVVLGEDMKDRLIEKGCPRSKLEVIANWQDLGRLRPADGSTFRHEQKISDDTFIVMHSGNIGFSQDLDTLLQAADLTKGDSSVLYAIVGDGGNKEVLIRKAEAKDLKNVRFFPYQSSAQLADSLSAANVHYVSLLSALTGLIVPSKIYGILAAGRAVIANVSDRCEVARIVLEAKCGVRCNADPTALADSIRALKMDRPRTTQLGQNGRRWIEAKGGRTYAAARYVKLLDELVGK